MQEAGLRWGGQTLEEYSPYTHPVLGLTQKCEH